MIDSAGYFGGILSGYGIGALAQNLGWYAVFISLAVVALITLVAAVFYWRYQEGAETEDGTARP